jgi:hypothetical protein
MLPAAVVVVAGSEQTDKKKGSLAGAFGESKPAEPVWIAEANQTRAAMA